MTSILVVDDEPRIVELASEYLRHAGYDVIAVGDGRAALEAARTRHPDLIVLDLGLPEMDGLAVTKAIRRESALPIVILTARTEEADRILGLELGADDYMTKPFSPRELVARVRAVLRRSEHGPAAADRIEVADLAIDVPRMEVTRAGQRIDLTATEFQLLLTLAQRPGRVFTRGQLLDAVHGEAFDAYDRAIDTHIKNLRRKIEDDPRTPRHILTAYGVGYRFADSSA